MDERVVRLNGSMNFEAFREYVLLQNGGERKDPWQRSAFSLVTPALALWFALPDISPAVVDARFRHEATPGEQNFWIAVVPTMIPVIQMLVHRFVKPTDPDARQLRACLILAPLLLILLVLYPPAALLWKPVPLQIVAAAFFPWSCYLAFNTIRQIPSLQHRRLEKQWDALPSLRRPFIGEVNSTGIWTEDEVSRNNFKWAHFIRYGETTLLLLLYTVDSMPLPIPKQAVDPSALARVRSMFRDHITADEC